MPKLGTGVQGRRRGRLSVKKTRKKRPSVGDQLAEQNRRRSRGKKDRKPPAFDPTSFRQHEEREQRLREQRQQSLPPPPTTPGGVSPELGGGGAFSAPSGPGGGGISSPGGPFGAGGVDAGPGTPLDALRSTLLGTPSLLRQGLGQRNLPSQTGALAGLRKLF